MFAAMCYAYGYDNFRLVEQAFGESAETYREQVSNIKRRQTREPQLIVDMGAGRGELAAAFIYDGVPCYAVDPAPGAAKIIPETLEKWANSPRSRYFIHKSLLEGLKELLSFPFLVDTVILCEVIEHVREDEFDEATPLLEQLLSEARGLLIVTNWVDFHPIPTDGGGWDHIRVVDDGVYDDLASRARKTIFRRGAHLILQY